MNEPGFQPNAFQSDVFQVEYDEVLFALVEGADIAAFTTTATTFLGFNVVEGADLFASSVTVRTYVTFGVTEGADLAAFNLDVKTYVTFGVTEGADIFSAEVLTGAMLEFDLFEGPDVPQFRTFATWWDLGDADFIYLPYEKQAITLTQDSGAYILVPAEDRDASLQNEWQRVDVDQQGARRRETT